MVVRYCVRMESERISSILQLGATSGTTIAGQSGTSGSWAYQFSLPTGITFDNYNNMYVLDSGNSRVQLWKPGATYGITVVATTLYSPRGIKFDSAGNLVIADTSYHRILSFNMICRKFKIVDILRYNFFWSLAPSTTTTAPPPSIY